MQELYTHIATLLSSVAGIKTVAVWNNQTNQEVKELSMFLPAAYFSATVNWLSASSGVRQGEATVNVYIATQLYETQAENVVSSTDYMSLVDEVYQKFAKAGFISLTDIPDTNHGNVPVHVSSYRFLFYDKQLQLTNTAGKKLIKDNPELIIQKWQV